MDLVKEAFSKIKEEILVLKEEILVLKEEILVLKSIKSSSIPTHIIPTPGSQTNIPTTNPLLPQEMKGSENEIYSTSTGNEGVQTNKQTTNQIDRQTDVFNKSLYIAEEKRDIYSLHDTIETLDSIKKDIRLRFKRLTPQEMAVFSSLYGLETQGFEEIDYRSLASNLRLSESSIRDYITKLIAKGVPIKKVRLNNKKILLSVSPDLKKIASLSTILKLREI